MGSDSNIVHKHAKRFKFQSVSGDKSHVVRGYDLVEQNGNVWYGEVLSTGLKIEWQDGPAGKDRENINGAFVEDVLAACKHRIEVYQDSPFKCGENSSAIYHIEQAIRVLQSRRKDRRDRGVEGANEQ